MKRITMLSPIQGGTAYGLLTIAGSPYTVDDAFAAELVNRAVAVFTDPPVPTSVYATFATYMTAAQFAQLTMGAAGVTYEITDVGGRPQYRWNGTAFVSIGSGSGSGGGGGVPTPVPAAALVPLNTYTEMSPLSLTADTVFVPNAATAVQGGSANLDVVVADITKRITFDARWKQISATALVYALNQTLSFSFFKTGLNYLWDVVIGKVIDATPPTFGVPVIDNGARSVVRVPMGEALGPFLGTTASITTSNAGGRTVSIVAASGSDLLITYDSAWAFGSNPSVAVAAGTVQDIAGNVASASGVLAVTNSIQPNNRVDTLALAGLATSDGGSPWVAFLGAPSKVAGHFTRPNGVRAVLTLEAGKLLQNQLWNFNPGPTHAGLADFNQFCYRFTDINNYVGIAIDAANSRVQAFAVVGGANVISAQVDDVLTSNANNTARGQFPSLNSFTVDINGTNIPGLTLDITPWASSLTSTKLAYFMTELEAQATVLNGLA